MTIQLSDHFTYPRLLRFVLPSVVMMIFTSIYGVVDGLFVSNFVGKTPFAAINLIMPFIMLLGGVGFMLGTGGSALVAKTMGEGRPERANQYFSMMIAVTVLLGVTLSAVGFVAMPAVSRVLGATPEMMGDCVLYGRITMVFGFTFMLQNVFQAFLITAEKPSLGLKTTVAAGIANMVLDAVCIAGLGWGVAGAAIATGLSQCVGGLIPLVFFLRRNGSPLRLTRPRLEARPILRACSNGASEMVSNVTASIVGMLYNQQLLRYAGENGVAAYGVLMYIEFIFIAIFVGYSVGSAPIISFHYGAQHRDELNSLLRKSLTLMGGLGIGMLALAQGLAAPLAHLFVGYDEALCALTVRGFCIFSGAFLVAGVNIFASSFFTALNNGGVSALISFLRTFLFKLSAVLLLPIWFGLDGIWWANVFAEVISMLLSVGFLVGQRKRYGYA